MEQTTKNTYRLYWHHVRKYKLMVFLLMVPMAINIILESMGPIFYKRFFDTLATSANPVADADALLLILLQVLGINALAWVAFRVAGYTNTSFKPRIMADLGATCFTYLQKHSNRFFINRFVGSLVRKVNRLVNAFDNIADNLYWDLYPLILRVLVVLCVLFYFSPILSLIIFVWTMVYITINYTLTMYKLKFDVESARMDSVVSANMADAVTNNINVKMFASYDQENKRFFDVLEKWYRAAKRSWRFNDHVDTLQYLLMILLEFTVLAVAVHYWRQGVLTIGHFVLLQAYLISLFSRLWDFGRVIRNVYEQLANAKEMMSILEEPHEIRDVPNATALRVRSGLVQFQNVQFSYNQTRRVLKNFSLEIRPGEKVGIVGPSGAGKTTLIALLLRLYDIDSGKILIDSQNIMRVTQDSLRTQISLVPQDPILFHRTLKENIRYGKPRATNAEVIKASKAAHCHEFIGNLSDGYDTYVGERGIKLSGGERQRVAIARAILKNAPILALDEATSSLDSESERMIQDALAKLMWDKTTLVIAHRLSTIMKMDRIIVVNHGQIVEQGPHAELLRKKNSLYKKLWDLQVGGFME